MRKAIAIVSATILVALAGVAIASDDYTDVGDGNIFHDEIAWMAEEGIGFGYGDGTFGPSDDVTRGQMSAFLYRLFNRIQQDIPDDIPTAEAIAEAIANVNIDSICEIFNLEPGEECQEELQEILQGEDGEDGQDGADGANGVSGYEVVGVEVTLPAGADNQLIEQACPEGKVVVGGGYDIENQNNKIVVHESAPTLNLHQEGDVWVATGWVVRASNPAHTKAQLQPFAVCANAS